MKLFLFSDPHGDRVTAGVDRYGEVARAMDRVADTAIAERADAVVCLGDLAEPDSGPRTIRTIAKAIAISRRLSVAKIPFALIPGNHDVFLDGSGESVLTPLAHLQGALTQLFSVPCVAYLSSREWVPRELVQYAKARMVFLPYVVGGYDADAFLRGLPEVAYPTLVFSHLTGLVGAKVGDETLEMARGKEHVFPLDACVGRGWRIFSGHFHERQIVRAAGGVEVHVVGSLARLSFGAEETNEPGYLVVEV